MSSRNARCCVCDKMVYAMERMDADGKTFHKTCMKCAHCGCTLKLGNYAALEGIYYCKVHYKQLFKLKGNYDSGFGREQAKMKWAAKGLGYGTASPATERANIDVEETQSPATESKPDSDVDQLPAAEPSPAPSTRVEKLKALRRISLAIAVSDEGDKEAPETESPSSSPEAQAAGLARCRRESIRNLKQTGALVSIRDRFKEQPVGSPTVIRASNVSETPAKETTNLDPEAVNEEIRIDTPALNEPSEQSQIPQQDNQAEEAQLITSTSTETGSLDQEAMQESLPLTQPSCATTTIQSIDQPCEDDLEHTIDALGVGPIASANESQPLSTLSEPPPTGIPDIAAQAASEETVPLEEQYNPVVVQFIVGDVMTASMELGTSEANSSEQIGTGIMEQENDRSGPVVVGVEIAEGSIEPNDCSTQTVAVHDAGGLDNASYSQDIANMEQSITTQEDGGPQFALPNDVPEAALAAPADEKVECTEGDCERTGELSAEMDTSGDVGYAIIQPDYSLNTSQQLECYSLATSLRKANVDALLEKPFDELLGSEMLDLLSALDEAQKKLREHILASLDAAGQSAGDHFRSKCLKSLTEAGTTEN